MTTVYNTIVEDFEYTVYNGIREKIFDINDEVDAVRDEIKANCVDLIIKSNLDVELDRWFYVGFK